MNDFEQHHNGMTPRQVQEHLYDEAIVRHLEASGFDYRIYLTPEELAEYDEAAAIERTAIEQGN